MTSSPRRLSCCSTASLRGRPGSEAAGHAPPQPPQGAGPGSAHEAGTRSPPGQLLSGFQAGCDGQRLTSEGHHAVARGRVALQPQGEVGGHCRGEGRVRGRGGAGAGRLPTEPRGPPSPVAGSQRLATSSGEPLTQASGCAAPGQATTTLMRCSADRKGKRPRMLTGAGGSCGTGGPLRADRWAPHPPCPTGPPGTHHALQVGLLERGFHHRQNLGPKCRVCNWSLLQDLGDQGAGCWLGLGQPTLGPGQEAVRETELEVWRTSLMGGWMEETSQMRALEGPEFKLWLCHLQAGW